MAAWKVLACSARSHADSQRVWTTSEYMIRVAAAPSPTATSAAAPTSTAKATDSPTRTTAATINITETVTRTLRWTRRLPAMAKSLFVLVLRNPAGALEEQPRDGQHDRRDRRAHRPDHPLLGQMHVELVHEVDREAQIP